MGPGHERPPGRIQRQIMNRLLDECVTTLHEVQDAIRGRLDGQADADQPGRFTIIVSNQTPVALEADLVSLNGGPANGASMRRSTARRAARTRPASQAFCASMPATMPPSPK